MTMRVVITECDHDAFVEEQAVAAANGVDLVITQSRTRAELIANATGADGILVQYARIDGEVLDALPGLKVVGRYGVGLDNIDLDAAAERGIPVRNVPDYGTEAVSDHAIGLALAVARGITTLDRGLRAGRFDLPRVRPLYQIRGRIFGVIGLGRIGTATAHKAAGLGYRVIGTDIAAEPGALWHGIPVVSLDELLSQSQVVSLHTPLDASTRHLLDADRLAQMRPDAIVVNTSRGGVIDTEALVAALRVGKLAGAGIDVHESEPLPSDHPLTTLDNVVLTPHLAWYTEESYGELKRRTMQNVVDVLKGER